MHDIEVATVQMGEALARQPEPDWGRALGRAKRIDSLVGWTLMWAGYEKPKVRPAKVVLTPRSVDLALADSETARQVFYELYAEVERSVYTTPQQFDRLPEIYDRLLRMREIARRIKADARGNR